MSYKNMIKNLQDERKQNVILVASQMFLKKSIDEVSMGDIAAECEIGVASLYRYFGNKTTVVIKAGELLWKDTAILFEGSFDREYYNNISGLEQISELMKFFIVMYTAHKPFLKFMHDFDLFVIRENVSKENLRDYERSILDFFPLFETAYSKGVNDGTVKDNIDYKLMYFSVTHALTSMGYKFILGDILSSDSEISGEAQLIQIISNAIYFIKN